MGENNVMRQTTNKPDSYARAIIPIIFVLDTSGAMHGQPISVLNNCMQTVIKTIGELAVSNYDVSHQIGILQVHSGAHWIQPDGLVPADKYEFEPLDAGGLRDMGEALSELNRKLSRKEFLASAIGFCKPIIIFMTCGMPTDSWEDPLKNLKSNNRWYQNALKIGFALTDDADIKVLCDIVGNSGVVIQTDDYISFDQAFQSVVINSLNHVWLDHITDFFDKEHSIEDIVKEVLDESGLIDSVNISVYSGETPGFSRQNPCNRCNEDMDSALKTMMAYSEIWTILNLLEDSYATRVPLEVKAFFEEERLKDYEPQIDLDKPLMEQNLQRKTMVLLAMLNVNYWCDSEEEREFWLREMAKNDNREYDLNDTFWDLRHIFEEPEKIYDNNDEYPTKTEEENHALIHMPNGELTIYVNYHDRKTIIPLKFFESYETIEANTNTDPALEIYLWNSWGPVLDVKNIGLDDIYSRQTIAPESTVLAVDGSKLIHKTDDETEFQVNMVGTDAYIKNISKSAAEILRPIHKGEKISVDLESALVNREGKIILSISTPDGWIYEEWNPDNEW